MGEVRGGQRGRSADEQKRGIWGPVGENGGIVRPVIWEARRLTCSGEEAFQGPGRTESRWSSSRP